MNQLLCEPRLVVKPSSGELCGVNYASYQVPYLVVKRIALSSTIAMALGQRLSGTYCIKSGIVTHHGTRSVMIYRVAYRMQAK